jgi:hypothetical protein
MATNIVGTFPILSRQKSQTDEYGFDYVNYQYILKTSTVAAYIPKKDDVFNGLKLGGYNNNPQYRGPTIDESQYAVTRVESNPLQGDLTELSIDTVGTKNAIEDNLPQITIRQGGPLIFGLGSDTQASYPSGIGKSGVGLQIELKFLGLGGNSSEATIYNTYFGKPIPSSFRGVSVPEAVRPFSFDFTTQVPAPGGGVPSTVGISGIYHGYCCKNMITERRGLLTLYTLTFEECGYAQFRSTTAITVLYDFPIIG